MLPAVFALDVVAWCKTRFSNVASRSITLGSDISFQRERIENTDFLPEAICTSYLNLLRLSRKGCSQIELQLTKSRNSSTPRGILLSFPHTKSQSIALFASITNPFKHPS